MVISSETTLLQGSLESTERRKITEPFEISAAVGVNVGLRTLVLSIVPADPEITVQTGFSPAEYDAPFRL